MIRRSVPPFLLDLREHETALHSKRVQEYAMLLARYLGIKEGDTLEGLEMGALLHDVGKIGVPDSILLKKGGLTAEERDRKRGGPVQSLNFAWQAAHSSRTLP